jgi:regulator-associated protein of mTOR
MCRLLAIHGIRKAWDLAAEFCLSQLEKYLKAGATPAAEAQYEFSQFFAEQLTAFEVWLQFGSETRPPPMQLPVVLQVQFHPVFEFSAFR